MSQHKIRGRIFDLHYGDVRLMQGGTAYASGWQGATRVRTGEAENNALVPQVVTIPHKGWINLFERSFAIDSSVAKPGIYVGAGMYGIRDYREGPVASQGGLVQYRAVMMSLVLACEDDDIYVAMSMRDQLKFNVKKILLDYQKDTNWWWLEVAPQSGQLEERDFESGGGQGEQGRSEATAVVPILVHYQFSKRTVNA